MDLRVVQLFYISLICGLHPVWTTSSTCGPTLALAIAIAILKVSQSLANVYISSTITVAVLGSFNNCCTCSISKEQSIPVIKLLPV